MAPRAAHEAAKKKAKKQKKVLMVLALPMLAALVYAYMTLTSLNSKPASVSATPAAETTPAAAVSPGTAAAPTVTPGVAAPSAGTLSSLVMLGRKDPFHDDGPHASSSGGSTSGSSSSSTTSSSPPPRNPIADQTSCSCNSNSSSTPKHKDRLYLNAVISVNGKKSGVAVGSEFGRDSSGASLFQLVVVDAKKALVSVVGTKQYFVLHAGKPLTLQASNGRKYTLLLEPRRSTPTMHVVGSH